MGKGGAPKVEVTEYRMSIHFGMCVGAVDALTAIWVGERLAWSGNAVAQTQLFLNNDELFGGIKKEGGASGLVEYLPGGPAQVMPEYLAARLGRSSATCPGYRGLASVFFTAGVNNRNGFYWSANNPYLRSVWTTVVRSSKGLSGLTAMIGPDNNPAHMLFECLTNTDWGKQSPTDQIDVASFEAAATTLFDENFGLSMIWTQQSTIEAFCMEILDHIQGTLFVNPRTGLMTLKLIREDYDLASLRTFDPDNAELLNYQMKLLEETTNEIVVTWTNPINEENETVSIQNIANIAMQGGQIISDSRNYYGVRNAVLAATLAGRDLRTASSPLRSADMLVDRSAWDVLPGEVIKLQWPEYGIDFLPMRVGNVDYGKPGDPKVKVSLLEDIFKSGHFIVPSTSLWIDPSEDPAPMEFARIFTLPAFIANQVSTPAMLDGAAYPEALAAVLAATPGRDTSSYELLSLVEREDMTTFWRAEGEKLPVGRAVLTAVWSQQATTVIADDDFPLTINGRFPEVGGLVFIGDATDAYMEIARIRSFTELDGWTLDRGVLDTVPRAWPIGTPVWFVSVTSRLSDPNLYAAGETVSYKLLPRTSKGILPIDDAPVIAYDLIDRPWLPNRPGNVNVEGVAFGEYDATADPTLTVTWANRNRLTEDSLIVKWADGNVMPEVGQTTTITLLDDAGTVIDTIDDLAGISHDVAAVDFGGIAFGYVRLTAKREGLESLQGHEIGVTLRDYEFVDLADAPANYTGEPGSLVQVASNEAGLQYAARPTVQVGLYQDVMPPAASAILSYVTVEAWSLPPNLAGCQVKIGIAATATSIINIQKNGAPAGTISITGTVPTLATVGGVAIVFAPGDVLTVRAPDVSDATLGEIAIVLSGPKV